MGNKGCNSTSRTGNQSSQGVSCKYKAKASSVRSKTCPKPIGTGAGNNKAMGHSANKTKDPLASGQNQLARNRLQRSKKPNRSKVHAEIAPKKAPKVLSSQSTLDGTLAGKKSCKDSMFKASNEPINTDNTTAGKCRALLRSAKVTMKPSGA